MIAAGGKASRWAAIFILLIFTTVMGLLLLFDIFNLYTIGHLGIISAQESKSVAQSKPKNPPPAEKPKDAQPVLKKPDNSLETYAQMKTAPPRSIGIYISNSPDDPAAVSVLDWVKSSGFDTVYNYSIIDGTPEQIESYLNQASARGIKVIVSLKDLYDELPGGSATAGRHAQFGSSNEQIAQNIAAKYSNHPAVWGFAITDEAPMDMTEVGKWRPILEKRYRVIKSASNKPVMAVLVGKTSPYQKDRINFLSSLKSSADTFALDYYPIPFQDVNIIQQIGNDLISVGDQNGWFIAQTFSWQRYPDTARALGFNVNAARAPNSNELIAMSKLALSGGAKNILFYSYFDIAGDPAQLANVAAAVKALR